MQKLQDDIKRIQDKLQQLLKQHQLLQKDKEKLELQLKHAQEKNQLWQQQSDELMQQVAILKVAKTGMNDQEKKDFEKRINQQIKEIDKCISMLSE